MGPPADPSPPFLLFPLPFPFFSPFFALRTPLAFFQASGFPLLFPCVLPPWLLPLLFPAFLFRPWLPFSLVSFRAAPLWLPPWLALFQAPAFSFPTAASHTTLRPLSLFIPLLRATGAKILRPVPVAPRLWALFISSRLCFFQTSAWEILVGLALFQAPTGKNILFLRKKAKTAAGIEQVCFLHWPDMLEKNPHNLY